MKSRDGKSQRREEKKKEDQKREYVRRKKIQLHEKVGKPRNAVFFQWFVAPEGRKVGSLSGGCRARWQMRHEKLHAAVAWSTFRSQNVQHTVRTTIGSWDVEKVHAVVARSTCRSQNVQNTPGPDHFWKLRCRKSARHKGAKHILKWKCTKLKDRITPQVNFFQ